MCEMGLHLVSWIRTDGFRKPAKPKGWREKTSQEELGSRDVLDSGVSGEWEG
jgi:hypothetical protein